VGSEALASPLATLMHMGPLLTGDEFWTNVGETFMALGCALLLSCVLGAVLGAIVGMSPLATEATTPVLVTLYALPKIALYPVVLLFCGVGFAAKVVFGAMYGFIPMMLIVINAIQSMNPALPKTARIMRLTKWQTLGTVVLPAMVPELVTGIRVSFSITFLGVMIGEMFGSTRGLGYILMRSINVNDTATIMAVTALVAVFAVAVNAGLLALDKATHHA
jgi:NitT/TauT family transport system permease protein